jgi:hypothetical protein
MAHLIDRRVSKHSLTFSLQLHLDSCIVKVKEVNFIQMSLHRSCILHGVAVANDDVATIEDEHKGRKMQQ